MTSKPPIIGAAAAVAALAASLGSAHPAFAWGDEGHQVVALIAWSYLAAPVRARVNQILAADGDGVGVGPSAMAAAATWADRFRSADRRTAGWHYTDLEVGAPDFGRACDTARSCAPDKAAAFATVLADRAQTPADQAFALKMVLHLVGDLHQPLHSATAEISGRSDAGGNCERVMVSSTDVSVAYRYTARPTCDGPPIPLPAAYRDLADRTAAEQLKRAGVRLAVLLNESLGQ
jgi:hypothetical protein